MITDAVAEREGFERLQRTFSMHIRPYNRYL